LKKNGNNTPKKLFFFSFLLFWIIVTRRIFVDAREKDKKKQLEQTKKSLSDIFLFFII